MIWYFAFPVLLFVFIIFNYKRPYTGLLVILILLFFSMFRGDQVGTDTGHYIEGVERVVKVFLSKGDFFEDNGRYEYLYYIICVITYALDWPSRAIVYIFSIITFFFLYQGSKRLGLNIALVCLFYVMTNMYVFSFNIARQFAAISIMYYGLTFLKEDNWRKYLFFIWVILGGLLHNSVILCTPLFFCSCYSFNRNKLLKVVFVFYFIAVFVPLSDINFYLLKIIGIANYSEKYDPSAGYATEGLSVIGIVYKSIIGGIYYYIFKKRSNEEKTDLYDNLFLAFIIVNAIFAYGSLATFRLKFNFEIISCIFLAIYFAKKNRFLQPEFVWYTAIRSMLMIRVVSAYDPYYLQF